MSSDDEEDENENTSLKGIKRIEGEELPSGFLMEDVDED